jgi:predicted amidohydrolase
VGTDGNGILHSGESAILSGSGTYLKMGKAFSECVVTATLSKTVLKSQRKELPFQNEADSFGFR